MRLMPLAAVTVLAAVPLALATPAAANNLSATVSPSTVAPGGNVSLNVEGCGTKTGRASSSAFGDVILRPGNLEATNLFGSATVFNHASPGSHPVTFECGDRGGRTVTVHLTVTPGAARGGMGGSLGSLSPSQIAIGGALVAGALGSGVWLLRRRADPGA